MTLNPLYEEIEAPSFHFNRKKSTAKRVIHLYNYANLAAFLSAEFPATIAGYPQADDVFPNPFNFLYVKDIEVEQMSDKLDGSNPPNPVNGYKITVSYESEDYNNNQLNSNKDLPGGGDASSGGPGASGSDVMLGYKVDIGGNFVTYPTRGLEWASDGKKVQQPDVQFGVVELLIEHTITWHHVALPPWGAIRRCAGRVNNRSFLGAPTGCLLFAGANCTREFDMTGSRTWTMEMRFSEKPQPQIIAPGLTNNDVNLLGAGGWNYFLRPDLNPVAYDVLVLAGAFGAGSKGVYPYTGFDNLFIPGGT